MKESRVGIPHEICAVGAREPKSTIYMYNSDNAKEKMLILWIDKKKRGSKTSCLTTMHDSVKVSRDIRKKPHPLVFYDKTKGGVDIVDYISSFLSTFMKSKRWPMNAFCYMLDTEWTNTRTLHDEVKNVHTPNFHFMWYLGESLVLPHVQRRYAEQQQHLGSGPYENLFRLGSQVCFAEARSKWEMVMSFLSGQYERPSRF